MLPLDCSELTGQLVPAEAPIILSQPRTGKADHYDLIWRPRHEHTPPVLEYVIKYKKVKLTPFVLRLIEYDFYFLVLS